MDSAGGPGSLVGIANVTAAVVSNVCDSTPGAAFDATANPAGTMIGPGPAAITASVADGADARPRPVAEQADTAGCTLSGRTAVPR